MQGVDIAYLVSRIIELNEIEKTEYISEMAEATIRMVTDSIHAFINKDLELAHKVIEYDDVVDDYFDKVKNGLITLLKEGTTNGEQVIDYLMIAKYLERIGDHSENIAKWVVFSITGVHEE